MAWTTPLTAVSGQLTAAQWNTHIRDNLNATMAGKATDISQYFSSSAANTIGAKRATYSEVMNDDESTTSTSYTNLKTYGPSVTVTTSTRAIVAIEARHFNTSGSDSTRMSVAVSGATTSAATDSIAIRSLGTDFNRRSSVHLYDALTAGVNTFTAKYMVSGGTGKWAYRRLMVMPF